MNPRVREIAVSAGMTKMNQRSDGLYVVSEEVFDNFAELIVQKCVSEVALMGITNFENEDISWACRVIIDGIKTKFGDINEIK